MQNDVLPTYSVRASKKARYLQLRIRSTGLEVVIPRSLRLTENEIKQFVFEKKPWLDKHAEILSKIQIDNGIHAPPESVFFRCANERWHILYRETSAKRVKLTEGDDQQILIEGAISNQTLCVTILKYWIKKKSSIFLENRLKQLSEIFQMPFSMFAVRDMQSRWGSCSSQKKISLCTNLVFLPAHLMDHVLLHELCHTKYMSHGKRFWGLLERVDPNARKHARELREASQFIPNWLHKRS